MFAVWTMSLASHAQSLLRLSIACSERSVVVVVFTTFVTSEELVELTNDFMVR